MKRFAILALVSLLATSIASAQSDARPLLRELAGLMEGTKGVFNAKFFENGDRPDGSRDDEPEQRMPADAINQMRAVVERVRAIDENKANQVAKVVDELDQVWKEAAQREAACRAAPKCMSDRLTPEICQTIEVRRQTVAAIAIERRNPAGVVDLARLHELGETLQILDEQIKAEKATYQRYVRRAFQLSACSPRK
jgi:hypothetical protein